MSQLYYYIATRTTYDVALPQSHASLADLSRDVSNAFHALTGGTITAGELKIKTTSKPPIHHLLCDGSTLNRIDFPQLADALGVSEDAETFNLPNFIGTTPEVAPTAPAQTVTDGGTVDHGGTVQEPIGEGETGGTVGGEIPSGGRIPRATEEFE